MRSIAFVFDRRVSLVAAWALILACDRSPAPAGGDGAAGAGGGSPDAATSSDTSNHDTAPELGPPSQHRPVATACTNPSAPIGDASADSVSIPSCFTDSDCAVDLGCACDLNCDPARMFARANLCIAARCHTDADCGDGGFCSLSVVLGAGSCGSVFYGETGFFCHTPDDECTNDSDCAGRGTHSDHCQYGVGHWICGGGP